MHASAPYLNASEAALRLGVSAKALRLYEQRGLVKPLRTAAGWRAYGPDEMERAAEVVALRALGLSLDRVARVLKGEPEALALALAAHQAALEAQIRQIAGALDRVRGLRADLAAGRTPIAGELPRMLAPNPGLSVTFDLPWPWGGERFELNAIKPLTYITGPLGCGKTRLALRLAEVLPGAAFLSMDRAEDDAAAARAVLDSDADLKARVDRALAWLVEEGAEVSPALIVLLTGLEADGPMAFVVDMVEQGLDQTAQEAVIAYLRRRSADAKPMFLMTRSNAILDLAAVGPNEAVLFCPANHSPPRLVDPYPGAAGYEAVASCLASPEVRARTEGMRAWRPQLA